MSASLPEPADGTSTARPARPGEGRAAGVALAADPVPGESAPDLLALDRQVCFALAVAARDVIALYRPLLAPLGLTHPQYLVMLALWEEAPLRVADLAARLSLEPATLSPLLKRLQARGLVTRGRDPRDERALALRLTPEGVAARAQAERIPAAIMERLGLGVPELEQLRDGLGRLIAAARDDPATPDHVATSDDPEAPDDLTAGAADPDVTR